MGSKRYMLENGLAVLLRKEVPRAQRVVDPFCGSGSVVFYVAENYNKPVLATDLQKYSAVLANSIINRDKPINTKILEEEWLGRARQSLNKSILFKRALKIEKRDSNIFTFVKESRQLCEEPSRVGPIWSAYGGHYYSPSQALSIDYLIKYLPIKEPKRSLCLASLISSASKSAASPGHTAQPFRPTDTAGKFIRQSWRRDIFELAKRDLNEIAPRHALIKGEAYVDDIENVIKKINSGDLVFIDPPYSGVQYSRFYHVLETIARGHCGPVSGVGRYPDLIERPQSKFSNAGQSLAALEELLQGLSRTGASVIFTFPKGECSNGLSGSLVKKIANKYFNVENEKFHVRGYFSTLGGNNKKLNRPHKIESIELLLLLKAK